MKISIIAKNTTDITPLLTSCTWSGDRTQAARKLDFTFIQDDRDSLIPAVDYSCGYTVHGFDDDGNLRFVGNIYQVERDRAKSEVHCVAYDNCFVLNRSKSTKKFTDALPEEIAAQMCKEMGVLPGNIAKTGEKVSFIANSKTGYQIILSAYTEAHKKNKKLYQVLMNADKLDVIEKGTLIENFDLDSAKNMTESIYRESIEQLINQVQVVDDKGNGLEYIKDEESIQKHSVFSTIYKQDPNKDTKKEAEALLTKPKREGNVVALGNYDVVSSYSIKIKDFLFTGQFWIKSDTHTFKDGLHEMKLKLEFENIMTEEKAETEKPKKESKSKNKSERKRKSESEEKK